MYDSVQRHSRTRMVLPLRLWMRDHADNPSAALLAHTVDTSEIGCRLGGLRTKLPPGQIITLQRGQQKADFRVIWTKELEPNENQAGIEALDYGVSIWRVSTSPDTSKAERVRPGPAKTTLEQPKPAPAVAQTKQREPAPTGVEPSKATFSVAWTQPLKAAPGSVSAEQLEMPPVVATVEQPKPRPVVARIEVPTQRPAMSQAQRPRPAARVDVEARRFKVPSVQEKLASAYASAELRWCVAMGFALVLLAVGLYQCVEFTQYSRDFAFVIPAPTPPTDDDLARLAPKAHGLPAWLTKPLAPSASRVQVAEAPTGHVIYPAPPDDLNTGKVQLQIVVAANGLVKQIHLLSGRQPLALAAARAVKLWHYAALATTDSAHERETTVTVSFLGADTVSLEFPRSKAFALTARNN